MILIQLVLLQQEVGVLCKLTDQFLYFFPPFSPLSISAQSAQQKS